MTQNPERRRLFMNVPEINGQPYSGFLRNHKYFGPILCRDDFLVMSDLKEPWPIFPKMRYEGLVGVSTSNRTGIVDTYKPILTFVHWERPEQRVLGVDKYVLREGRRAFCRIWDDFYGLSL
jgi:hypothetical protein